MKIYPLTIIVVCWAMCSVSYGQNEQAHLDKYWNYRDRLVNYFVKPGDKVGESLVAYARNKSRHHKKGFTVGDQTIDLGWYFGILATEYALLSKYEQSVENTIRELHYAFMAFDRLDRCETLPPWNLEKDTLDGFFHRYDVQLYSHPEIFSIHGRNKDLKPHDTWGTRPPGVPTYISGFDKGWGEYNFRDASASQDQVMHLLMGFALVYKCLPDSELFFYDNRIKPMRVNFHKKAIEVVDRILSHYMQDDHWIIKDPLGENVERGYNSLAYAFPLAIIGKQITGKTYDAWSRSYLAKKAWDVNRIPNWVNDYNSTMALILAALSDSWWDYMPWGKVNNTGFYISKCGQPWHRETFFLLLYQFLHDKTTDSYSKADVLFQIETAPFNGPYHWAQDSVEFKCCGKVPGKPPHGWAYPNKFRGTKKEQDGRGRHPIYGNFSGIDYLLLYNLYHLIEDPIPYKR